MILKNYYRMMAAYFSNRSLSKKCVTVTGGSLTPSATHYSMLSIGTKIGGILTDYDTGVVFGDGDTPVKVDDYRLSGNVITGISGSATLTRSDDETGATVSSLLTIINNNTDDVTIKEVGTCAMQNGYDVLLERTVLDSPVTIPAGGVGQITYTIRMNYPT